MAGVTIGYKGNTIATIQGSGSKTLKTAGKYCEGDISVDYVQEGGGGITPTGTKSITANGTYDVTNRTVQPTSRCARCLTMFMRIGTIQRFQSLW